MTWLQPSIVPLSFHRKKIKQLLSFTYGLVNNRYVYLYRSLVKGIIVTVNIYNILIVKGNIAKVEVILSHIYCPPIPLLMGVAKGTTYPLNKLFRPLVILYFHILCFRCSGHKPHTILSPQMICLLNQVCVDGYEVKNRVTRIMMQQSSTMILVNLKLQ